MTRRRIVGTQDYGGTLSASHCSTTIQLTRKARPLGTDPNLRCAACHRIHSWSGKLWAVVAGVRCQQRAFVVVYDADIVQTPDNLSSLVARLLQPRAGCRLSCQRDVPGDCSSFVGARLVPAFVYFFQMLSPFASVQQSAVRVACRRGAALCWSVASPGRIGFIEAYQGCPHR